MKKAMLLYFVLTLTACGHMPSHSTNTADEVAQIDVLGAPIGTVVYVDDEPVGTVTNKISKFSTPSGTHAVRVVSSNGLTLFEGDIFLTKNITRKIPTS